MNPGVDALRNKILTRCLQKMDPQAQTVAVFYSLTTEQRRCGAQPSTQPGTHPSLAPHCMHCTQLRRLRLHLQRSSCLFFEQSHFLFSAHRVPSLPPPHSVTPKPSRSISHTSLQLPCRPFLFPPTLLLHPLSSPRPRRPFRRAATKAREAATKPFRAPMQTLPPP